MNRLRVLKQRAARGTCGIAKLNGRWHACTGLGGGDISPPMSRREAIHLAARWALPAKPIEIVISCSAQ